MKVAGAILLTILVQNVYADSITITCPGVQAIDGGAKTVLFPANASIAVTNDTDTTQAINFSITVCPPNTPCSTKNYHGNIVPRGQYVTALYTAVRSHFVKYGSYWYPTTVNVTGYKTLTKTQNCEYRVIK